LTILMHELSEYWSLWNQANWLHFDQGKMIAYLLGVYSSLSLMFVMLGDILRLCSGWCVTACNIIHARGCI
jgi:hypothetical protein